MLFLRSRHTFTLTFAAIVAATTFTLAACSSSTDSGGTPDLTPTPSSTSTTGTPADSSTPPTTLVDGGTDSAVATDSGKADAAPKTPQAGDPCKGPSDCPKYDCGCNGGGGFKKISSCKNDGTCPTKAEECSEDCLGSGGWDGL